MNNIENEYRVKSELLLEAMWGDNVCHNRVMPDCVGYFNADSDRNSYGRGFLEFCVSRNFNIHRLPGYEQYYIQDGTALRYKKENGALSEAEVNEACKEIRELYDFTQRKLVSDGIVNDGKVRLVRSLRTYEAREVAPQLKQGRDIIEMPANIITSYSMEKHASGYENIMYLTRQVSAEDILMVYKYLYHPEWTCASGLHGGEFEVWVIDRSIFGMVNLLKEDFELADGCSLESLCGANQLALNSNCTSSSIFSFVDDGLKPCEYDTFTKKLIKRNMKKLQEQYQLRGEDKD